MVHQSSNSGVPDVTKWIRDLPSVASGDTMHATTIPLLEGNGQRAESMPTSHVRPRHKATHADHGQSARSKTRDVRRIASHSTLERSKQMADATAGAFVPTISQKTSTQNRIKESCSLHPYHNPKV